MSRKGRFGFDPTNTTADGHYKVGKGRPPEHGKFRKGDGRQRGRRPKGTKNLAADLREELSSSVAVTVGGVPRKVSRQRAIVMRLADNATKGQTSAIALALEMQQRLVDPLLEQEKLVCNRERDLSCLTDLELRVMIYLTAKIEKADDVDSDIIGVIPVYAADHFVGGREREGIEAGLKAYGIEVVNFGLGFPPECRLINNDVDHPADDG